MSLLSIKDNNYEQHQSLDEINNTIHFDHKGSASQKFLAFLGPGLLVAVGYMDQETGLHLCKVARNTVIPCYS